MRAAVDTLSISADSLGSFLSGGDSAFMEMGLPPEVRQHLDHISAAYDDTPLGMSLMKTAMIEAEIAAAWVRVAGMDSVGLGRMQSAMRNVLHALDPGEVPSGEGMGYGFRRAAEGIGMHTQLALAAADSSTAGLAFHGPYMARAAAAGQRRADDAIALAYQVQGATDVTTALRLIDRLAATIRSMTYGSDADEDHRIGHSDGEVGLAQAAYHLSLVYRRHGLEMPDFRPDDLIDSLGLDALGVPPGARRGR